MSKGHQRPVAGNYIGLPYDVADRAAYMTASLRAKAVLSAIQRDFNGFNNGRLCVSRDTIAERIGSKNHAANRAAIAELVERGLLVIEKVPPPGSRMSTEYRLTFIGTGDHKNPVPPSAEYASWTPEPKPRRRAQPGGNFTRTITERRNTSRGSTIEHTGNLSGSMIEPQQAGNTEFRGSVIEQHISNQRFGEPAADCRPACIPDDRWILAGKRAAENPAGPTPDELRAKVGAHISRHGPGSQCRLADDARIPRGSFSKFRRGTVDLSNAARVRLACSLERMKAAEEMLAPRAALSSPRRPALMAEQPSPDTTAAFSDERRARSPASVIWTEDDRLNLRVRIRAFVRNGPTGTNNKLAAAAGMSASALSNFVSGGRSLAAEKLVRLAAILDRQEFGPVNGSPFGPVLTALEPSGDASTKPDRNCQ